MWYILYVHPLHSTHRNFRPKLAVDVLEEVSFMISFVKIIKGKNR